MNYKRCADVRDCAVGVGIPWRQVCMGVLLEIGMTFTLNNDGYWRFPEAYQRVAYGAKRFTSVMRWTEAL